MMRRNLSHAGSPTTVLTVAEDIVAQKNRSRTQEHYLRVVQCGSYEVRRDREFRLVEGT